MKDINRLQKQMGSKPEYKGMGLKDGAEDGPVRSIPTSQNYDMGKLQEYSCGSKGYPSQAAQMGKVKY